MATNRTATIDKEELLSLIDDTLCDICVDSSKDIKGALVLDFHTDGNKVIIEFEEYSDDDDDDEEE